jgi:dTDP-glucose 4,6-dehydratase
MEVKMKTYLVTGGAGFIGSNFILYLLNKYKKDIKVINLDALTYAGNLENLKEVEKLDNYEFRKIDICDKEAVMKVFETNNIDRVIHFAAESHVDRSIRNPEIFVNTNVLGTLNLINAAKQSWETPEGYLPNKKYVQVSTDEVYGALESDEGFFYETTPLNPHSPYSASKASADFLIKAYIDTFKFPANITRCSNNYVRLSAFDILIYQLFLVMSRASIDCSLFSKASVRQSSYCVLSFSR